MSLDTSSTNDHIISHIHPINVAGIHSKDIHNLYGDPEGGRLEIQTYSTQGLIQEISGKSGFILGMTHSSPGNERTETFFIQSTGEIYAIGLYSGLTASAIESTIFYILLNPHQSLEGWTLLDLAEQKKEHAHETKPMIGIDSSWGKTVTFHPDLEAAIQTSKSTLQELV